MVRTITTWIGDQQFESSHEGNKIRVDGNKKEGHGPKALLLSALAACSGIDVVEILQKMRIEFSDFSIEVETEQTTEHPKVYKDILAISEMRTGPWLYLSARYVRALKAYCDFLESIFYSSTSNL